MPSLPERDACACHCRQHTDMKCCLPLTQWQDRKCSSLVSTVPEYMGFLMLKAIFFRMSAGATVQDAIDVAEPRLGTFRCWTEARDTGSCQRMTSQSFRRHSYIHTAHTRIWAPWGRCLPLARRTAAQLPSCPGAGHVLQGTPAGSPCLQAHPKAHLPEAGDVTPQLHRRAGLTSSNNTLTSSCAEAAHHQCFFFQPVPSFGRRFRAPAAAGIKTVSFSSPERGKLF